MSFTDTLISWNNVGLKKIIIFLMLFVIGFFCIFYPKSEMSFGIVKLYDICIQKCETDICKYITTNLRDDNYSLGDYRPYDCIFTIWELSHVILHMFLGYYYNIYISISLSVLFELYEHYFRNCGSFMDLFWNTVGLLIGVIIRYYTTR